VPIKKSETVSFTGKWMVLEIIVLNQICQMQKKVSNVFSHMEFKEKFT
jgi:hypothetical protein